MEAWSGEGLVAWAGGDLMVRAFAGGATRGWCGAGAVAMVTVDAELRVPVLLGAGARAAVAEVVAGAAGELAQEGCPVAEITVPRGALGALPAWLRPRDVDEWDWRAVTTPPAVQPGEDAVQWLDETAYDEVTEILRVANPGTSVWPDDAAARRWAGVRAGGRLVAVLADTSRTDEVGHVSGIATAPAARGAGHAAALTAWAARRLLAEGADLVTLGVFSANAPALRLYDRLGFTADHPMSSGRPPAGGPVP